MTGEKAPLYEWLRKLRASRQSGEARRLFYVAVTRARRELVMSGLVKKKGNSFSTEAESPVGWLSKHYGIDPLCGIDRITCPQEAECAGVGVWKNSVRCKDGFFVQVEPGFAQIEPVCSAFEAIPPGSTPPEEWALAEFEREKPVLTVISPSGLAVFTRDSEAVREEPAEGVRSLPCPPSVWGTLVHALLAEFGKRGAFPSAEGARAALHRLGIEGSTSTEIALGALREVASCLDDPWLRAFYSVPSNRRRVEWPAECAHSRDVVYSGIIDLAVEIEGNWGLVDFKTSRPLEGEQIEDFLQREIEAHTPQLLGYREICAKLTGKSRERVDAFIYWTALRTNRRVRPEKASDLLPG